MNSRSEWFNELTNSGYPFWCELRYIDRDVIGLIEVILYSELQLLPPLFEESGRKFLTES